MAVFHIDGSGWNGKESKYAVVMVTDANRMVDRVFTTTAQLTNNEAEYYALIEALKLANDGDVIYTDSQLVIGHLTKGWNINYPHLQKLVDFIRKVMPNVKLAYVPRELNFAGKLLER